MNSIAGWVGATGLMALAAICPQESLAESFTGAVFLKWNTQDQASYINNAVVIATIVATRTNPETATCLDSWYSTSSSLAQSRNSSILQAIEANAEYHPGAVIVLVLEEACGGFAR